MSNMALGDPVSGYDILTMIFFLPATLLFFIGRGLHKILSKEYF